MERFKSLLIQSILQIFELLAHACHQAEALHIELMAYAIQVLLLNFVDDGLHARYSAYHGLMRLHGRLDLGREWFTFGLKNKVNIFKAQL